MATTGHWYINAATGAKVDFTDPSADIDFDEDVTTAEIHLVRERSDGNGVDVTLWKHEGAGITGDEITAAIADQDDAAVPELNDAPEPPSGTQGAAIAAIAAPLAALTGGEPPTEAEFNLLRGTVANLVTAVNALIESAEDQGALAEN